MSNPSSRHIYSILTLLILSFAFIQFSKDNSSKRVMIDGDGSGHYSWLPSIFIYHTLDFTEVYTNEIIRKGPGYQGHNYHEIDNILINKFTPGSAILIAPFFILAIIVSFALKLPVDGYNIIFQYSVGFAALFWVWFGLVFLYKLLLNYGIKPKISFFLVLVSFFGTNLLAYTFLMPAFSHVYSFALISALLYFTHKYFLNHNKKSLVISALLLGIVFTVRPVNILVILFLPFLAGDSKIFLNTIKAKLKGGDIIYAIIAFIVAISPYLIVNYLQTGHLIYFAYKNEGFYWSSPQIINFLFGFRKGWFVYTPIMLFLFPALALLFRKNKYQFFWFALFFVVLVYVFSSWWNWFYGDSFGMRPMVDFTAVFTLVIILSLKVIRYVFRSITLIYIFLIIILNMLQTYQYAAGIIHPDSMSKEAYFHVFLKTSENYSGRITGGPEYYFGNLEEKPFYSEFNDFEKNYPNWAKLWNAEKKQVFSGDKSLRFGKEKVYSPSLSWIIPDSLLGKQNIYVKIESMVLEPIPNAAKNALFVMDIQNSEGKTVFYKTAKLKQMPDNNNSEWRKLNTGFKLPKLTKDHYLIKIYVWNPDKTNFVIDDFDVGFYRY